MNFSMNLGVWNSVFAVPSALVDKHIKMAGSLQLKVLLWVLRHAGENFRTEDISVALGANTADINDAMCYWTETGIIAANMEEENQVLSPFPTVQPAPAPVETPVATPSIAIEKEDLPKPPPHRMPKPDGLFIAQRINQSEEIGFLMQESQQVLGRPISPGLSSTLLLLHDDYGLPVDVIIMLLQYIKGRGKDNTSYIESVGKNWAEESITTHEKVEEKLRSLDEISKAWRALEQTVGIDHRSPSTREEQYANRWLLDWKFAPAMVRESYERCVNATGKLNMSYMNRILERWHKDSIFTPEQAAKEQSEKTGRQTSPRQPTYDIDEYEKMTSEVPESYWKE